MVETATCTPPRKLQPRPGFKYSTPESMKLYTPCVTTRRYLKLSPHPSLNNMSVHSGCLHNEVRSLEGRVLRPTYEMDPMACKYLNYTAKVWGASLQCLPYFPMEGLLFTFPRHRRRAYLQGLLSLLDSPIQERDAFITAFVKCEKIDVLGKDGDPRMIQARSIRWNLELGRFTRVIEHQLYTLKDRVGLPLVAKGRNPTQRASDLALKWNQFRQPVALCLDLSRWDMHVRRGLLEAVKTFYLQVMPSEHLAWLISHMVVNRGVTANGARYVRADGVTSGDMTTALGNCLAVCLMLRAMRQIRSDVITGKGVSHTSSNGQTEDMLGDWKTMIGALKQTMSDFLEYDDGDDHTFMCESTDAPHYQTAIECWYRLCGHKLTVEGVATTLDGIVFCQSRPLLTSRGWLMVSNPKKTLCNAFMVPPQALGSLAQVKRYLQEVFVGRAIVHAGEPYLGPMFARLANFSSADLSLVKTDAFRMKFTGMWLGVGRYGNEDLRDLVAKSNAAITSETKARYCELWGMDPEILQSIVDEPLPSLRDPKRSVFYSGNPVSMSIDTITDLGIVTRNVI
nr:MAG: RNA-dependent RNA polymerase [Riboviria sp.]